MTKKIAIIYTFLFLFAFTFALSFTLASKAQAVPSCCILEWCDTCNPPYIGWMGHEAPGGGCIYNGAPPCDFIVECCDD